MKKKQDKTFPQIVAVAIIAVFCMGFAHNPFPNPDLAIQKSNFVTTASITEKEGRFFLKIGDVLKGKELKIPTEEIVLVAPEPQAFSVEFMMSEKNPNRVKKDETIIFVGNYDSNSQGAIMIFNAFSIWPKYGHADYYNKNKDRKSIPILDATVEWIKKELGQ